MASLEDRQLATQILVAYLERVPEGQKMFDVGQHKTLQFETVWARILKTISGPGPAIAS